jgi:hypothetical protein
MSQKSFHDKSAAAEIKREFLLQNSVAKLGVSRPIVATAYVRNGQPAGHGAEAPSGDRAVLSMMIAVLPCRERPVDFR